MQKRRLSYNNFRRRGESDFGLPFRATALFYWQIKLNSDSHQNQPVAVEHIRRDFCKSVLHRPRVI